MARAVPRAARPALHVLCTAQFLVVLDITAVFVVVPAMGEDLGLSPGARGAVVSAYALAVGLGVIPAGRIADAHGRRRAFVAGMALFGAASLACGLAPSGATLVAARVAQGLGAALIKPSALALLSQAVTGARGRAAALAAWGSAGSLAAASGALLGGLMVEAGSWRLLFLVNVPVAAAAIVLAARVLPAHRPAPGARPPRLGAALRSRTLAAAATVAMLHGGMMLAAFALLPLYMEGVLGLSAVAAGAGLLAVRLTAVAAAPPSGRLVARHGPRPVMVAGMVGMTLAVAVLARVPAEGAYAVDLLPALLMLGIAIPLALITVNALTLEGAPPGAEGAASAIMNAAQWLGGALGAAAASALAGPSGAAPAALAAGVRDGFAATAAAGVVACGVALAALGPSALLRGPRREEGARGAPVDQLAAVVEGET